MQTVHKRSAVTPVNGLTTNNGHHHAAVNGNGVSTMPATKQPRRRKKRSRKASHVVEDWIAVILGVLILLGCLYWILSKLWMGLEMLSSSSGGAGGSQRKRHYHEDGESPIHKLKPVPFNSIYHIPESHELVGDRSDRYAKVRKHWDEILPKDFDRSLNFVRDLRDEQEANEYNVVPIIAHESTGSLHQHHQTDHHHRHHHRNMEQEEENINNESGSSGQSNEEEHEEEEEEAREEAKLMQDEVYDIYNCPDEPVPGYPYAWPIMTLLDNWSPDDTTIPDAIYQGLCVFDFQKDYDKAMNYRDKEVPFIVQNDPDVARTVERWNKPGYMQDMLDGVKHRTEYSHNNHFMYHLPSKGHKGQRRRKNTPADYKPPTEMTRMTYMDWLDHANVTAPANKHAKQQEDHHDDEEASEDDVAGPDQDHWYFRLIGCGLTGPDGSCDKGSSEYLFDELPYFQPVNNLYLRKGEQQKGIHCRFGMKGVIAENHFDGSRNSIVLLGGSRRYILAHPDQCEALSLFPNGHPSARHSQVDYTHPDLDSFPQFAEANANEVILQPGDVLYLPTHWFHYIVSLELNFQCNTRSGIGFEYEEVINDCGF